MRRTVALGRALLLVRAPSPPNLPKENLIHDKIPFKAIITAAFDAHDLGEAAHFLGMAITRHRRAVVMHDMRPRRCVSKRNP